MLKLFLLAVGLATCMIRGKTDRADARFISRYGWMRKDELKPMKPVEQNLVVLQNLMTYRDKMVVDRASYQVRIKELQGQMGDKYHQKVGEGKPKMSVLNIIRAKLIERIFTVVKRGSPYEIRLAA